MIKTQNEEDIKYQKTVLADSSLRAHAGYWITRPVSSTSFGSSGKIHTPTLLSSKIIAQSDESYE